MNNINNKQKPKYGNTDYQDVDDYNSSLKKLWESQINLSKEIIKRSWKNQWKLVSRFNESLNQPVWISEYLGRKQFYSQNKLPVELNLIIEEMIAADYTHPLQQLAYKELVERDQKRQEYLKEIADCQEHINDLEREKWEYLASLQEKEIAEILAKEIKEYREKRDQYLATTKPLLTLPKMQSKIKVLGNKLKTEFKQVVKLPSFKEKPINNPFSIYRALFITCLMF